MNEAKTPEEILLHWAERAEDIELLKAELDQHGVEVLRQWRKRLRRTQASMARFLGVSRSHYTNLENNVNRIPISLLASISGLITVRNQRMQALKESRQK